MVSFDFHDIFYEQPRNDFKNSLTLHILTILLFIYKAKIRDRWNETRIIQGWGEIAVESRRT